MTYESRLTLNYAFGTLDTAAAVSDLTLSSPDFATALPGGLSTTTYVPITLQDPSSKVYEIVWSTGHAAAAATATVVRGREASAARAWPSGTLWTCAPTLRDAVLPVPNRAGLPADPHVGLRCLLQDEQITIERYLPSWGPPTAHLRQNASQAVNHATNTLLQWQIEDIDNANGHDNATQNTRYTCRLAGWYQLAAGGGFNGGIAGYRSCSFLKNGVMIPGSVGNIGWQCGGVASVTPARTMNVLLALNDYVEVQLYQDSGSNTGTSLAAGYECTFSIRYIGGV